MKLISRHSTFPTKITIQNLEFMRRSFSNYWKKRRLTFCSAVKKSIPCSPEIISDSKDEKISVFPWEKFSQT